MPSAPPAALLVVDFEAVIARIVKLENGVAQQKEKFATEAMGAAAVEQLAVQLAVPWAMLWDACSGQH